MAPKLMIIVLLIIAVIVSISGCTTKNATNGTFGEKSVSINNISIVDNVTAEHAEVNGVNYYYIVGYLKNNNNYDVYNLKMKANAFDAEGNVVATNDTVYLDPKAIYANKESYFGFNFIDNGNRIVRYELQIISISATP